MVSRGSGWFNSAARWFMLGRSRPRGACPRRASLETGAQAWFKLVQTGACVAASACSMARWANEVVSGRTRTQLPGYSMWFSVVQFRNARHFSPTRLAQCGSRWFKLAYIVLLSAPRRLFVMCTPCTTWFHVAQVIAVLGSTWFSFVSLVLCGRALAALACFSVV